MTMTLYRSTDASAPALTGATGTLNDLLDAILINGYGAKAAAGWTIAYTDASTKTKAYRPAAGPRHYLQSRDAGPGSASFREARWRGYVAMSAFDTGTEPFPTAAQLTNGYAVRKSATLDATPRAWLACADDSTIALLINAGDTATDHDWYFFGKFNSWKSADDYASCISGRTAENSSSYTSTQAPHIVSGPVNASYIAAYAPRSFSGLGTSAALYKTYNSTLAASDTSTVDGASGVTYPSAVDGGILLSPLYVGESGVIRGVLPGLWRPCHARPLLNYDYFSALDGATTRDWVAVNVGGSGQVMLETSDTWYTA
jgi:hypothetical protein